MTLDAKQISELKAQVVADIDRRSAELIDASHQIHAHPELNFEEHFAHELLTSRIEKNGLPVTRKAYGLDTAFETKVGNTGLDVAVLCEYDALPGIGHACGHNVIAAAGLGAGLALAQVADHAGGRLTLMGTPAEEGGGGKVEMARAGAFKGIAAAMMVHPADRDLARMNAIAIQQLIVRYYGQAAHAAVSPHLGRNALDAAVLGYMNVAALRQHIRPTERIHGIFTKAGEKANIVPREAETSWYVRSDTIETLQPLKQRVAACVESSAVATDCRAELHWEINAYADIVDNVPLLDAYAENSTSLGRPLNSAFLPGTGGGSTDMGNVSYLTPTIHPMLQVSPRGVSLHSPQFAEYTTSKDADKAVLDGAKIMAMTVIDLWTRPELQQNVKNAFGDGAVPAGVL
ncbi:MAG: M20 family metallopeptidase [Ilumatobacteraceae bacterium]